ncbi:arrestin domain-containing protein 4 [Misgurnus anguillicaudatus]|uniref:arrestin domain-containing protein 4 n=1 Tax=Misgurnus anguillicaudatus TaxID=75329 RepID=UPI003CCF7064
MKQKTLNTLAVVFNNEQKICYSPGNVVAGRVLLQLSAPTKVEAIEVLVKGCARVRWPDKLSQCSQQRNLLSLSKTLAAATGTQDLILDCGFHEFPFKLELPQTPLVSSFIGKHGCVYYMAQAVLKLPHHKNQCVSRRLFIISHTDVNIPALTSPVSQTCEKMIGRWIFTSGPISLTVSIDRKGYCNGESIPISAEIKNGSSCLVVPKAAMYQIQTYMANGKRKIFKHKVASARGNIVPSHFSDRWSGNVFMIPPVCPSILNSDILKVEYRLAVIVQISGTKNLKVEFPIVIGTIPYRGPPPSGCFSISSYSSADMSFLTPRLPDEAPPSYADVVASEDPLY